MADYIRNFSEIAATDIGLVGGKGANLAVLFAANINIPNGFCITTKAYKQFIAPTEKTIYKAAQKIDIDNLASLRKQAQIIRNLLQKNPLPQIIADETVAAWREFGTEAAYAVRSSATAEDLPQASFAGQQDTYLNIIGQDNLLNAVKKCFISLFTDRAILYRMQNGFNHADVALSVVVQKMVLPQSSGIMFTADPISGNRNVTSIDASFGLGEALVSGLVSADLYKVDKTTNKIIHKDIADKKLAIIPLSGGGVETVDLTKADSHSQTLDDDLILKLAQLGARIEAHYGQPQDIEWALADGQLYITQSRPITTLFPMPENGTTWPKSEKKVFLSFGHPQMMTEAMPPLALSVMKVMVPFATMKNGIENELVFTAGGRLYIDTSHILNHPKLKKIFPIMVGKADQQMSQALVQWVKNNPKAAKKSAITGRVLAKLALPFWAAVVKRVLWQKHQNIPHQMGIYADKYIDQIKTEVENMSSYSQKLGYISLKSHQVLSHGVIWKTHLAASMLAMFLVGKLTKKLDIKPDVDAMMRGLKGNVTTQMDLAVGDLADAAQASEALKTHILAELNVFTKIAKCLEYEGGQQFLTQWQAFLAQFGARCTGEINIYNSRWDEDPTALMLMVMAILKTAKLGAHQIHYQNLMVQNQIAVNNIIKSSGKGVFGFVRKPLVKRFIYVIRQLFPLREHHKFMIIKYMYEVKKLLLEIGDALHLDNKLPTADAIWFISIPEILDLLDGKTKINKVELVTRQQDYTHFLKLDPPRLITSDGEILTAVLDNSHAPQGALVGSPVSAGICEGIAKVITDPTREQLHKGEILVAPHTDPGWTPLFVNAAALVCEVGGLMTHGSVIAREYGLPAVVGVPDATKIIKTGDRLRVHGDAGYVEILSKVIGETA
ncbi:MAG: phosphoenolpyruvate synthase [Rhizobiales bacterium]|nr:phosphoenolpyruvate synthase [Hyphomicrobiales bacterium]NRB13620.1 phosphoenolpyruvate synthase [Hyphomicrobiales bacterium]